MPIEVVVRGYDGKGASQRHVSSRLSLEIPQQVFMSASASDVAGYEKIGSDLSIQFTTGDHLYLDDFFVLGENGDYSRLMTQDGSILVTGLIAPEPDTQGSQESTDWAEVFPEDASSDEPQTRTAQDTASIDQDGTDPILLVGAGLAGLATSSAVDFFDDTSSGKSSSQSSSAANEGADEALDDLLLSNDEDAGAEAALFAASVEETDADPAIYTETAPDLLSDLFVENAL